MMMSDSDDSDVMMAHPGMPGSPPGADRENDFHPPPPPRKRRAVASLQPARRVANERVVLAPIPVVQSVAAAVPAARKPMDLLSICKPLPVLRPPGVGLYCRIPVNGHPIHYDHVAEMNTNNTCMLELLVPRWPLYKNSALDIIPDGGVNASRLLVYERFIRLLGALASESTRQRMVMQASEDGDGKPRATLVDSPFNTILTVEYIPHKNDASKIVAYCFRLAQVLKPEKVDSHERFDAEFGIARDFYRLLRANTEAEHKPKPLPKNVAPLPLGHHSRITVNTWHEMVSMYRTSAEGDLGESPCITRVLRVRDNLAKKKNLGAPPAFYDAERYCGERRTVLGERHHAAPSMHPYQYADPARVYRIHFTDLSPATIANRRLPSVRPDRRRQAEALREWTQLHGDSPGSIDDFWANGLPCEDSQQRNDLDALERLIKEDKALLRARFPPCVIAVGQPGNRGGHAPVEVQTDEYFAALRLKQREWNDRVGDIIHPSGDASPAMRYIALHRDAWLDANNQSFCVPRPHSYWNLAPWMDAWVEMVTMTRTALCMMHTTRLTLLCWLGAMGVWDRKKLNFHVLLAGPPGGGKSNLLEVLARLLCYGTREILTSISPKALVTEGDMYNNLLLMFDDAQASMLGQKTGAQGNASDMASIMKNLLASQEQVNIFTEMEPTRRSRKMVTKASVAVIFNTNDSLQSVESGIGNRCYAQTVAGASSSRKSGRGVKRKQASMIDNAERAAAPEVVRVADMFTQDAQRLQILFVEVGVRMSVGVIAPTTMSAASTFFGLVGDRMMDKYGVAMNDDPRKFKRWMDTLDKTVKLGVFRSVWDGANSPFMRPRVGGGVKSEPAAAPSSSSASALALAALEPIPHHPDHFLATEHMFVAGVEHAFLQLGVNASEWEDAERAQVLLHARDHWPDDPEALQHRATENAKLFMRKDAQFTHDSADWWCVTRVVRAKPAERSAGGMLTQEDVVQWLAKELELKMVPRLHAKQLAETLRKLFDEVCTCTRSELTDEGEDSTVVLRKEKHTALELSDDKRTLRMNVAVLMGVAGDADPLFTAASEVLQHLVDTDCATLKTYIWGGLDASGHCRLFRPRAKKAGVHTPYLQIVNMRYAMASDAAAVDNFARARKVGSSGVAVSTDMFDCGPNSAPMQNVDQHLDKRAVQQRVAELGLSLERRDAAPYMDWTLAAHRAQEHAVGAPSTSFATPQLFRDARTRCMARYPPLAKVPVRAADDDLAAEAAQSMAAHHEDLVAQMQMRMRG